MALSTFRERCLKVATTQTNGSIFGTMPQKANTRLILSFFTWTTDSENSSIYHRFVRSARTLLILHIAIASHRYPIIIHQQLGLFSLERYYRGLSCHYYTASCTTAHHYLVQTRPHYYPCINPHILYNLGTSCTCQNDIKRMYGFKQDAYRGGQ